MCHIFAIEKYKYIRNPLNWKALWVCAFLLVNTANIAIKHEENRHFNLLYQLFDGNQDTIILSSIICYKIVSNLVCLGLYLGLIVIRVRLALEPIGITCKPTDIHSYLPSFDKQIDIYRALNLLVIQFLLHVDKKLHNCCLRRDWTYFFHEIISKNLNICLILTSR